MDSTTPSDLTDESVREHASQEERMEEVVRRLRTLLEGDDQEQRDTFAYLKRALEEDRPSNRRLFQ